MRFQDWIWLLVIQAVWTGSYAAMKIALREMPVNSVVFLRFGMAAGAVLLLWLAKGFPRFRGRDLVWIALIGFLDFALAPLLQVTSLRYTQAIDVSIIVASEPMLTVLIAAVAIGERPGRRTLIALLVAVGGMLVLSGGGHETGALTRLRLFGNALFLLSLVFEASMTVTGRALRERYHPLHLMGAMLVVGFVGGLPLNLPIVLKQDFAQIGWAGWGAIAFLALGCSVFGYTAWYKVVARVPASRVALSLFLQPVIGSIMGWGLLHERITLSTFIGAVLICASLAWWQMKAPAPASS